MKKLIKSTVFVLCLTGVGGAMATEFFILNKTPGPLYYKLGYFTFGQAIGQGAIITLKPRGKDPFMTENWIRKQYEEKISEGWLEKDNIGHVKSYLLGSLQLKQDKEGPSLITSFAGDKRILNLCQSMPVGECEGDGLRTIKPVIDGGVLKISQAPAAHVFSPIVIVVTLDPKMERDGQVGYVITELAHKSGLFGGPKPILYEVQGMPTPAVTKGAK